MTREERLTRVLEPAALVVMFALIAIYASRLLWDIDVFWQVVCGRELFERRLDVTTDLWSAIDPGRPWVPLQWAYELLVHGVDVLGGLQGLRIFHALLHLVAFATFHVVCRRRLGHSALASLCLLSLLVLLYADRFRARAHVFNLLFEAMLLAILVRGPRGLDRRACLATAAIFGAWGSLHGGGAFLMLVAALALPAAALVERWVGLEDRVRRTLVWYACALVPALLSPFFVRSLVHTFGMVEAAEEYTYEWHPSWRLFFVGSLPAHHFAAAAPTALVVLLAFLVSPILGAWAREGRTGLREALARFDLHAVGVAVALLYLAHRSIRFIYLAAFALVILLPQLRALLSHVEWSARVRRGLLVGATVLMAAMTYQSRITQLYGSLPRAVEVVTGPEPLQADRFPVAQADFLARTNFEGRVFAQAMWGGYLLYRLWPRVTVLADGRGNHDLSVTHDLRAVGNRANMLDPGNGPEVLEIYERYGLEALVLNHPVWPRGYQPPPWWVLVHEDRVGQVWINARARTQDYLAHLATLGVVRAAPAPGPL